jgi:hypothetical protein
VKSSDAAPDLLTSKPASQPVMGHCEVAVPAFEHVGAKAPAVVGQCAEEVLPPMKTWLFSPVAMAMPLVLQLPLPQPPSTPPPISEE